MGEGSEPVILISTSLLNLYVHTILIHSQYSYADPDKKIKDPQSHARVLHHLTYVAFTFFCILLTL